MNEVEQKIVGVLECLDEAGNVILGPYKNIPLAGNPHATISQRLGQMLLYGDPQQKALAKSADAILTYIEVHVFGVQTESHCIDSIKDFPRDLPHTG